MEFRRGVATVGDIDRYTTVADNPFVLFQLRTVGAALSWVRRARGRSQESLSAAPGVRVSRTAIGGYESGKIRPSLEVFLGLLTELDVNLAAFERVAVDLEHGREPVLTEAASFVSEPAEPYRLQAKKQQYPWAPDDLIERWVRADELADRALREHMEVERVADQHRRRALQERASKEG